MFFIQRQEQVQADSSADVSGPHLTYYYCDHSILDDVATLLIHHVKRQTSLQKDDKHKIKQLLHHFIPDLFFAERGVLSDDDDEDKEGNWRVQLKMLPFQVVLINGRHYLFFHIVFKVFSKLLTFPCLFGYKIFFIVCLVH